MCSCCPVEGVSSSKGCDNFGIYSLAQSPIATKLPHNLVAESPEHQGQKKYSVAVTGCGIFNVNNSHTTLDSLNVEGLFSLPTF